MEEAKGEFLFNLLTEEEKQQVTKIMSEYKRLMLRDAERIEKETAVPISKLRERHYK